MDENELTVGIDDINQYIVCDIHGKTNAYVNIEISEKEIDKTFCLQCFVDKLEEMKLTSYNLVSYNIETEEK